jgi:hypothetical protein
MKIRKYTKFFENQKSAMKLDEREGNRWERSNLGNEYMPSIHMDFDPTSHTQRRFTVIYYKPVYSKTQTLSEGDLYGRDKKDAITKFKKMFSDNFPTQRLIIKSVTLKIDRGDNLKLFTFKYYTKKKK